MTDHIISETVPAPTLAPGIYQAPTVFVNPGEPTPEGFLTLHSFPDGSRVGVTRPAVKPTQITHSATCKTCTLPGGHQDGRLCAI